MSPEYLVVFYMIVCVAMSLFNFAFLFWEKNRDKRIRVQAERMSKELAEEIDRNAEFPTSEHRNRLVAWMGRLVGLESFDAIMDAMMREFPEKSERYLVGIAPVFEALSSEFARKDSLHRAYFAYIVRRWYRRVDFEATDVVVDTLLTFVFDASFYVRENTMEAIAAVGTAEELARCIADIQGNVDQSLSFNPRLITECAMSFAGDHQELARQLSKISYEVPEDTAVAILAYLRMTHAGDAKIIATIISASERSVETRIAAARYFMSNPYEPAGDVLREYALVEDASLWELGVACVSSLAAYPGKKTVDTLLACLHSANWNIRNNAAASLFSLGATKSDLAPILEGDDRFAKDMVKYHWQKNGGEVLE